MEAQQVPLAPDFTLVRTHVMQPVENGTYSGVYAGDRSTYALGRRRLLFPKSFRKSCLSVVLCRATPPLKNILRCPPIPAFMFISISAIQAPHCSGL